MMHWMPKSIGMKSAIVMNLATLGIKRSCFLVAQFHQHINAPKKRLLKHDAIPHAEMKLLSEEVLEIANRLHDLDALYPMKDNCAYRRANLIVEEVGEILEALANNDEVELLDGLADLLYVVFGTAVTYDLPIHTAFREVHCSNMTKNTARGAVGNTDGDRGKNAGYVAPRIKEIIKSYRAGKDDIVSSGFEKPSTKKGA